MNVFDRIALAISTLTIIWFLIVTLTSLSMPTLATRGTVCAMCICGLMSRWLTRLGVVLWFLWGLQAVYDTIHLWMPPFGIPVFVHTSILVAPLAFGGVATIRDSAYSRRFRTICAAFCGLAILITYL